MIGIMDHALTWITFLPVLGMVVILFQPSDREDLIKWIAATATGLQVLIAIYIYSVFDRGPTDYQLVEEAWWIKSFGIKYLVGIDGLSVSMVLLTALLSFICIFASWNIPRGVKSYFGLFLLLDAGMMGVFVALDFFLFYIFWEVMLLPMYFLIGIWGGPRREYAAIKFFLYTLFGSVLMLLAMLFFYFTADPHTFDFRVLAQNEQVSQVGFAFRRRWYGLPSTSASPSRCRRFRSTHGCPMPTWKRPRPSASSWLACC